MQSYTNLTPEEKEQIKQEQKGVCAICFSDTEALVIDHDHKTDFVRQALCVKCNNGLGQFNDDHETLLRAACYVIVHKANLTDIRIGYKLLFEEARRKEAQWMINIKKTAQEQFRQAKRELLEDVLADAADPIRTARLAALETFMSKDSEASKSE